MGRALLFVTWLLLPLPVVRALTIPVHTASDARDTACGTQAGTLRAAIAQANATPERDEIVVDPFTIQLVDSALCPGELVITNPVTIRACPASGCPPVASCDTVDPATAVIRGAGTHRVFRVASFVPSDGGPPLELCSITVRGGKATVRGTCETTTSEPGGGGAICNGGALAVRVRHAVLDGNEAAFGGAVWGPVELIGATLSTNIASQDGGGVWARQGSVVATDTTVAGNAAAGSGGGLWLSRADAGAALDVSVVGTTLSGNTARAGDGGAMLVGDVTSLLVRNATLSGNAAGAGSGGGVLLRASAAVARLEHVTVAKNSALAGGGVAVGDAQGAPPPVVVSSLLVDNTPSQCTGTFAAASTRNLIAADADSPGTCAAFSIATSLGDRYTADQVRYAALAKTTGPTQTHDLEEGSPAIGQADPASCPCTDQRGERRGPEPATTCRGLRDAGGFTVSACDAQTTPCPASLASCDIGAVEHRLDCDPGGGDGVPDRRDNCRQVANPDQADRDGDCVGDACDCVPDVASAGGEVGDADADGVRNGDDCCPDSPSVAGGPPLVDTQGCTVGQACSCQFRMAVRGGHVQTLPWCSKKQWRSCVRDTIRAAVPRSSRRQYRHDFLASVGDGCPDLSLKEGDRDCDGVPDDIDNCPRVFNLGQNDCDGDGKGDACDDDRDGDGLPNDVDKCPLIPSPGSTRKHPVQHKDADSDGYGNECDCCPLRASEVHADVDLRGCEEGQRPPDPSKMDGRCGDPTFNAKAVCKAGE